MSKRSAKPAWLLLLASLLVVSACNNDLDPGFYLCKSEFSEGILQVDFQKQATFYYNEGRLFAPPVSVHLKKSFRKSQIFFTEGSSMVVSLKPYMAPKYRQPSGISLYRTPRYQVKESHDRTYGHALGFWNCDPDRNENALIVFGRRTLDLLSNRKDIDLTMDIYYPGDDHAKSRPLLLLIHGGAFFNGDKEEEALKGWARHFASLGYVVSSINYRLGFRPTINEVQRAGYRAVQDANAAVRFLLQQDSLSIDPRLVFVTGTSAGAITALNLAYMTDSDRPEITRGGWIGDEGPIDAIEPPLKQFFSVRAVGNLWGAVSDTAMLAKRNVPVISFHGQSDPIVPYQSGYPFEKIFSFTDTPFVRGFFDSLVSSTSVLSSLLPPDGTIGNLKEWIFPEMHGSYIVDRILKKRGIHSELHTYPISRHSLHLNSVGEIDSSTFKEIQDGLESFFSSEMTPCSISLHQDAKEAQVFRINAEEVEEFFWKVEGGVVLETGSNYIRVLMLGGFPVHSVTVSGLYRSGMAFSETKTLDG